MVEQQAMSNTETLTERITRIEERLRTLQEEATRHRERLNEIADNMQRLLISVQEFHALYNAPTAPHNLIRNEVNTLQCDMEQVKTKATRLETSLAIANKLLWGGGLIAVVALWRTLYGLLSTPFKH
jgi:prefoldin subunit 5